MKENIENISIKKSTLQKKRVLAKHNHEFEQLRKEKFWMNFLPEKAYYFLAYHFAGNCRYINNESRDKSLSHIKVQ